MPSGTVANDDVDSFAAQWNKSRQTAPAVPHDDVDAFATEWNSKQADPVASPAGKTVADLSRQAALKRTSAPPLTPQQAPTPDVPAPEPIKSADQINRESPFAKPPTQAAPEPLSARAGKVGEALTKLTPPDHPSPHQEYWDQEYSARTRDLQKLADQADKQNADAQKRAQDEQETAKLPLDQKILKAVTGPGTKLGSMLEPPKEKPVQFESDYFKHRQAEAEKAGKSVWDALPKSISEALTLGVHRSMTPEQRKEAVSPFTSPLISGKTLAAGQPSAVQGAAEAIGGFTSPENLALAGVLGELNGLSATSGGLTRQAPRIVSGLFATQTGAGLVEAAHQYSQAKAVGDTEAMKRILGSAAVQAPMALLMAYHAAAPGSPMITAMSPKALIERVGDTVKMSRDTVTKLTDLGYTNQQISMMDAADLDRIVRGNESATTAGKTEAAAKPVSPTESPAAAPVSAERVRPGEKAVPGADVQPVAVEPVAPTKEVAKVPEAEAAKATSVISPSNEVAKQAERPSLRVPFAKKYPIAGRTDLAAESGAPLPTAVQPVESAPQAGAAAIPDRRSESSAGTPPEGTLERRLAPGPPPEQNRLLMEYRRKLNAPGTTPAERSVLESQIADISGTEGALRIGGGGEEMAQQIRKAREQSSGQPISNRAPATPVEKRETLTASEAAPGQTVRFKGSKGTIREVRGNQVGFQARGSDTIQYLDADAEVEPVAEKSVAKPAPTETAVEPEKPSLIGTTAHSNPLFDPEVWKETLGYLKPSGAAGQPNLRARTGELARKQAVLQEKLKKERARWRGRSDADMLAFADLVENGEADRKVRGVKLTPKTQALLDKGKKSIGAPDKNLAATMRSLLDEGRTTVQGLGTGKLDNFIENYFPHIWEEKNKLGAAVKQIGRIIAKRPMEGPKSFLKHRTIATTAEGFDKDLKPAATNPVDMAVLKMHEMNRYVMAHKVLDDLKGAGTAKFVRFGGKAPDGWRPLDDKVFQVLQYSEADKGMINRGRYYAPEEVAQPINRYVASGLKGVPVYDLLRAFGNSLNQVQLGLSGFHLGTTSLNAVISQFALATKQASRGQFIKAAGNLIKAPAAPIRNLIQGGSVVKAYLRPDQLSKYDATARATEQAGGRSGIGEEYIDNAIEKMLQSFANKKYFKGMLQAIPAAVEAQAIPVLKWTVPRMKLGAFHDLASDILARGEKKGWSPEQVRSELQKSWDSIDNRFGQVVYDNLNWNKVAKDLAFIGVRSVGWNYGTWRELGGGLKDTAAQAGKFLNGKGFEVTDRMAYMFMLPLTVAALGALYQYSRTGKRPEAIKDYFYPRDGGFEEDGTPTRKSMPSYMKDVFAFYNHPVDTALHKVNPALNLIVEMLENKDYYGNEIRNTDDPAMAQLWQAVSHVGKSFLPFTLRTAQKQKELGEKGIEPKIETFLGITPAPRSIERSEAEALAHDLIQRRAPAGAHTTAEQKKRERIFQLEQGMRDKTLNNDALRQKIASGEITRDDVIAARKRISVPGLVRQFKELSIPEALKVWDVASVKERSELKALLSEKAKHGLPKMTRDEVQTYQPLVRAALADKNAPEPSPVAKYKIPFMGRPTAKPTAEAR